MSIFRRWVVSSSLKASLTFQVVGQISLQAIDYRDYTMIQATGIIFAVAVVVGNLNSDILYSIVDPRIKTE